MADANSATTVFGLMKPGNGQVSWGVLIRQLSDQVDEILQQACPVGQFGFFAAVPTGWLECNGTNSVGNASSNATGRANADTATLFSYLWGNFDNTTCAVQDSSGVAASRGASAAADFAANRRILLPDTRERFIMPRGSTYTLGSSGGAKTSTALLAHSHGAGSFVYDKATGASFATTGAVGGSNLFAFTSFTSFSYTSTAVTGTSAEAGAGSSFSILNSYFTLLLCIRYHKLTTL